MKKKQNDGGPAFPRPMYSSGSNCISLRDYFAAQALNGILSNSDFNLEPDDTANCAGKHADAMMKERNITKNTTTSDKITYGKAKHILGRILSDLIDDCFDNEIDKIRSNSPSYTVAKSKMIKSVVVEILKNYHLSNIMENNNADIHM